MKILYLLVVVLKFLGILILSLLLLLLLLIAIILVVPVKYTLHANKEEETHAYASVKWLYSILSVEVIYDSKAELIKRYKLFGLTIGPRKPKKKKKTKPKKENSLEKPKEFTATKNKKAKKSKKVKQSNKSAKSKQNKKKKAKKTNIKDKIMKIQSFNYKKELLTDTISWIKDILKRIGPQHLDIYIEVGRQEPGQTGSIMAIVWAFYPLYYPFATIIGNYEKECLCGKIDANGSVTVGWLVYDAIKYIRKTSVKELIKFIRKK